MKEFGCNRVLGFIVYAKTCILVIKLKPIKVNMNHVYNYKNRLLTFKHDKWTLGLSSGATIIYQQIQSIERKKLKEN